MQSRNFEFLCEAMTRILDGLREGRLQIAINHEPWLSAGNKVNIGFVETPGSKLKERSHHADEK